MLPNKGHRLAGRHAVEHGDAGERGAGSPPPTATRDLDPLCLRAEPRLAEGVLREAGVGRQSEVRPADPAGVPGHGGRSVALKVDRELGQRALTQWST